MAMRAVDGRAGSAKASEAFFHVFTEIDDYLAAHPEVSPN
jgi:hypothetical protein